MILAGVKSLTLHDTSEVTLRDLGAQFYLSEADIGRNRAEACRCGSSNISPWSCMNFWAFQRVFWAPSACLYEADTGRSRADDCWWVGDQISGNVFGRLQPICWAALTGCTCALLRAVARPWRTTHTLATCTSAIAVAPMLAGNRLLLPLEPHIDAGTRRRN